MILALVAILQSNLAEKRAWFGMPGKLQCEMTRGINPQGIWKGQAVPAHPVLFFVVSLPIPTSPLIYQRKSYS